MNFMKKLLVTSLIVVAATSSTAVFAEDIKSPGSGPNPYTDCGIGAALFSETHWAAVTSNVIWDLGITALTSATASPQTCSGKKMVAAMFIGNTYTNLAEETATGQGEHLTTVLNLFECSSVQHTIAIQQMRGDMGQVVAAPNYMEQSQLEKAAKFYSIVEKAVSNSCSV